MSSYLCESLDLEKFVPCILSACSQAQSKKNNMQQREQLVLLHSLKTYFSTLNLILQTESRLLLLHVIQSVSFNFQPVGIGC